MVKQLVIQFTYATWICLKAAKSYTALVFVSLCGNKYTQLIRNDAACPSSRETPKTLYRD